MPETRDFSNIYDDIKGFDEELVEKFKKAVGKAYTDKIVTARKEWKCQICNEIIKKGEKYKRTTVKLDHVYATKERCLKCGDERKFIQRKPPKKKLKKFLFLSK